MAYDIASKYQPGGQVLNVCDEENDRLQFRIHRLTRYEEGGGSCQIEGHATGKLSINDKPFYCYLYKDGIMIERLYVMEYNQGNFKAIGVPKKER